MPMGASVSEKVSWHHYWYSLLPFSGAPRQGQLCGYPGSGF